MRPSLPSLVRLVPIPPPFYVAPSSVKSVGVSGYNHFSTPCRKILFRYHKMQDTHEGLRYVAAEGMLRIRGKWEPGRGAGRAGARRKEAGKKERELDYSSVSCGLTPLR